MNISQESIDKVLSMILTGEGKDNVVEYLISEGFDRDDSLYIYSKCLEECKKFKKDEALSELKEGVVVLIAGIAITIVTYVFFDNEFVLAYGAILVGLFLTLKGFFKYCD